MTTGELKPARQHISHCIITSHVSSGIQAQFAITESCVRVNLGLYDFCFQTSTTNGEVAFNEELMYNTTTPQHKHKRDFKGQFRVLGTIFIALLNLTI